MKKLDLSGQVFGMLTVLHEDTQNQSKVTKWICRCECGNIKSISTKGLRHDNVQSCGCKKFKNNGLTTRDSAKDLRLYNIWRSMKKRCYLQTDKDFHNYGERGISVCDEWNENFYSFYLWAKESGYSDNLSIDRIDTNGNYTPDNCRWVTLKTQQRNKRTNILLSHNGETKSLVEWCEDLSVYYPTVKEKVRRLRSSGKPITFETVFI